ncbi:MAG: hypothetical protein WC742_12085 [Gallionellaceae bacterium]|jgi:hypothetical protein
MVTPRISPAIVAVGWLDFALAIVFWESGNNFLPFKFPQEDNYGFGLDRIRKFLSFGNFQVKNP